VSVAAVGDPWVIPSRPSRPSVSVKVILLAAPVLALEIDSRDWPVEGCTRTADPALPTAVVMAAATLSRTVLSVSPPLTVTLAL